MRNKLISLIGLLIGLIGLINLLTLTSCEREPVLHLYDSQTITTDIPVVDLDLKVIWDYQLTFDVEYDWQAEWYYGWDENDKVIYGELGYSQPTTFNLRRYYTGAVPYAPHTTVIAPPPFTGSHYQDRFEWGFWDVLVWNEIKTIDGVQSHQAIEIRSDLKGFVYDEERNVYVRQLNMMMYPITYIYLTQVILHNNRGRITSADGNANLSGMARYTTLNTGTAGDDPIAVYFNSTLKTNCALVPYGTPTDAPSRAIAEHADIIGGRLMTFGMCGQTPRLIKDASGVTDKEQHYLDVTVQFYNGMDSTLVFDVTNQVRQHFKGGVITVELDMDTVPIPKRPGGSGFDAVVKEVEDGGTYEFEM